MSFVSTQQTDKRSRNGHNLQKSPFSTVATVLSLYERHFPEFPDFTDGSASTLSQQFVGNKLTFHFDWPFDGVEIIATFPTASAIALGISKPGIWSVEVLCQGCRYFYGGEKVGGVWTPNAQRDADRLTSIAGEVYDLFRVNR